MMNYNFIAPYYHFLSQCIFFNRQHLAHFPILHHIKDGDKILWIGGGAGKFIPELNQLNLHLEIDYIDFSSKMIELAQKQESDRLTINFIVSDIFDVDLHKEYDVVMTTFLFDHFEQPKAEELFVKINRNLKENGRWFYVDFSHHQSTWQRFVTNIMLYFFRIMIGLRLEKLPDMKPLFERKFHSINTQYYYKKYIESIVYQKIK